MKFRLCFALLAAAYFEASSAAPVLWTLQGMRFNDGGIATGSFVYDADLKNSVGDCSIPGFCYGTMMSWDIETSGGIEPPFHYSDALSKNSAAARSQGNFLIFEVTSAGANVNDPNQQQFRLKTISPLTDDGGTEQLDLLSQTNSNLECNNCGVFRLIAQGNLTGFPVSVPPSFLLLTTGLAGFLLMNVRGRLANDA